MKLDFSKAWNTITSLIGGNKDVVMIVAGVFFFLPYLVVMLAMPEVTAVMQGQFGDTQDPDAMMAAMQGAFQSYWWVFIVLGIIQYLGTLSLLALFTDHNRPTVGEAIGIGAARLVPYFVTVILMGVAIAVIAGLLATLGAVTGVGLVGFIAVMLAFVVAIYLFIKFSQVAPVMAIEGTSNPIKALSRSWALTKGNSFRILLFVLLIFIPLFIITSIVSMIFGLGFAAGGASVATIGNGLVAALMNAVSGAVGAAILAAIYRQLAGDSPSAVSETFE
ncbi:glycerophosphoryl diester phosphodiesterase membrane domain-containing protein [Altererythrobacter sp. ZODW24]|uniref:glycerophosphoryl diester phosphodiesterase membrane domain-containing protein n=1 Tax=Altererythrobacter sp. ZODW24 TaxID=2185142 RepID=UPI000DF82C2E|nr:glycerophosphoryl diester phosphodiesterase membrane domain-containing protein [Altererythrobacter sp. ZODW24]